MKESTTALIYPGTVLRVRWMYFNGHFPARAFLRQHPDGMMRFNARAVEMGDTGKILLHGHGHPLNGPYSELHQFNLGDFRSWGFTHEGVYVVVWASTKKNKKAQQEDYKKALRLRADYLERKTHDEE